MDKIGPAPGRPIGVWNHGLFDAGGQSRQRRRSQGCRDHHRGEGGRDFGSDILALADVFRANATPEERERSLTAWRDLLRALMNGADRGAGAARMDRNRHRPIHHVLAAPDGADRVDIHDDRWREEARCDHICDHQSKGRQSYASDHSNRWSLWRACKKGLSKGILGRPSRLEGLPIPQI